MATMASIKNSNISSIANQDSTQAFIDCILLYSKNLEADAVSIELQVSAKKSVSDSFLAGPVFQAGGGAELAAGELVEQPD